jgi:hypothetical protein
MASLPRSASQFPDYITVNTTSNTVNIISNTASTSNSTGALLVKGGLGVSGNTYTGNITITGATSNGIIFVDGTYQITSPAATASYANSAFSKANSAYAQANNVTAASSYANSAFAFANSAGSYANSAFSKANSAYALANTALANTAGVTAVGTIIVLGSLQSRGIYASSNIQSNVYTTTANINSTITGTYSVDISLANYFKYTITGTTTFTFVNPPVTSNTVVFVLNLTNGGAFSITWPASVKWPSGTAPTLTATGTDILVFSTDDAGTNYRGMLSQKDSR